VGATTLLLEVTEGLLSDAFRRSERSGVRARLSAPPEASSRRATVQRRVGSVAQDHPSPAPARFKRGWRTERIAL